MTSKQMKMTSFFKTSAPKEPKTFRQCLSDFIISGNHAFNIVEEPEFLQMIRSLSSNTVLSRYSGRPNARQNRSLQGVPYISLKVF